MKGTKEQTRKWVGFIFEATYSADGRGKESSEEESGISSLRRTFSEGDQRLLQVHDQIKQSSH